jgi:hypothetical protein
MAITMDETQPLLGYAIEENGQICTREEISVDFDPNGDPENPLEWPKAYKRGVVALLAFMAFTV